MWYVSRKMLGKLMNGIEGIGMQSGCETILSGIPVLSGKRTELSAIGTRAYSCVFHYLSLFYMSYKGKVGTFMVDVAAAREKASTPAIANPGPLGLSAFALTTFVLSAVNAGLLSAPGGSGLVVVDVVLGLALFYGGFMQFCAGMWEFRVGNAFGATAFSSYGGFWMAFGFANLPIFAGSKTLASLAGAEAVGVFLLGWTIFTGMMLLVTLNVSGAHIVLFLS